MNKPFEGVETFVHAANKTAFVIAGMHRSGTSALTRVVSMLGAKLPRTLMPPMPDNPKGYWESPAIAQLNDALLGELGSSWDDVLGVLIRRDALAAQSQVIDRIGQVIFTEFASADPIVLKEPRIGLLLDPWLAALTRQRFAPHVIIPIRNPLEVAASLSARNGFSTGRSLLLWLSYFLAIEKGSRGVPRVFVRYDNLVDDWRGLMRGVEAKLDMRLAQWTPAIELEIDSFLSQRDRHYVTPPHVLDVRPDVADWVRRAFAWSVAAATEEAEPDAEVLDNVAAEYLGAVTIFAPLIAEQRASITVAASEIAQAKADLQGQAAGNRLRDERIMELAGEIAKRDERLGAHSAESESRLTALGAELGAALAQRDARIVAVEGRLAELGLELAERHELVVAAESRFAELSSELVQRNERIVAAESRMVALEQDIAAHKRAVGQRDVQLQAKDAEIGVQHARVERLGAALHERDARVKVLEGQLKAAEAVARNADAERAQAESIEQIHAAVIALRDKVGALEGSATNAVLRAQEDAARAERAEAQARAYRRFMDQSMPLQRRARRALWRRLRPVSDALELVGLSARRGPAAALKVMRVASRLRASGAFDTEYYLRASWDVAATGRDPVIHYVATGAAERRDPSATFSSAGYLELYPDVAAANLNPLDHFIQHGRAEGRRPPLAAG